MNRLILALACTLLLVRTEAQTESDMDHGLDFDFSDEDNQEMIPYATSEEGGEGEDENLPEATDESDSDAEGWSKYLTLVKLYAVEIEKFLHRMQVRVNRFFLTREHKSADSKTEAFKFGMYDGLFKLQPRANSNCFTDGPAYATALYYFGKRFLSNHMAITAQEQFAFEDITQGFFHKCTLQDTLPATLFLNFAMIGIDELPTDVQPYFR